LNIVQLRLGELRTGDSNVRSKYSAEGLAELQESVREHGVLVPVLVREGEKGYDVLDGGRRVLVALRLGLLEIPAVIVGGSDEETGAFAWVLNFQREVVPFVEECRWIRRCILGEGITPEVVAVRLGRSAAYIRSRLAVLDWPPALFERCDAGAISFAVAREYAKLGDSDELVVALEWDAVNQPSSRQAAAYVEAILVAREQVVTREQARAANQPKVYVCGACGGGINWTTAKNMLVCGSCLVALGLVPDGGSAEGGGVEKTDNRATGVEEV